MLARPGSGLTNGSYQDINVDDSAWRSLARTFFAEEVSVFHDDPNAGASPGCAKQAIVRLVSREEVHNHAKQAYDQHVSHIVTYHALARFSRAPYCPSIAFNH
jgi:hypothetical protein